MEWGEKEKKNTLSHTHTLENWVRRSEERRDIQQIKWQTVVMK